MYELICMRVVLREALSVGLEDREREREMGDGKAVGLFIRGINSLPCPLKCL